MPNDNKTETKNNLRKRAEGLLREKLGENYRKYSESEQLRLIHELEVHRIELELQEEELEKINSEKEHYANEYDKLYDLHTRFILHIIKNGKDN